MSSKSVSRFEELDAGRALGDLSLEEVEEWEALAQEGSMDQTIDFDLWLRNWSLTILKIVLFPVHWLPGLKIQFRIFLY